MAWTATLIRFSKANGRVEIEISYVNGTEVIDKSYQFERITKKEIRQLAIREVKRLEAINSEVIDLPLDVEIDLTPIVAPTPPPPTAAQIAREDWFSDWDKLQRLLKLVNAGLLQANDSRIAPLQVSLRDTFLNSYFGSI